MYDALNVLMAMEIITKEKKNIMWRGLPTNTQQEGTRMQMELTSRKERLDKKRLHLQELLTQQISFKCLGPDRPIRHLATRRDPRNSPPRALPELVGPAPRRNLVQRNTAPHEGDRIPLPFIIVNTHKETVIDCEMAEVSARLWASTSVRAASAPPEPVLCAHAAQDKQEIFFNFSAPFEIHDDNEIMKRMQLHCCETQSELEALVPPHLAPYTASWQPQWQPQPQPQPPQDVGELVG